MIDLTSAQTSVFLGLSVPDYGNGVILMDNLSPGFAVDDELCHCRGRAGQNGVLGFHDPGVRQLYREQLVDIRE